MPVVETLTFPARSAGRFGMLLHAKPPRRPTVVSTNGVLERVGTRNVWPPMVRLSSPISRSGSACDDGGTGGAGTEAAVTGWGAGVDADGLPACCGDGARPGRGGV